MTQYNPNCPYCNVEIDFIEHDDNGTDNGDTFYVLARGICPQCKTAFKWYDIYTLDNFGDLEEDT